MRKIRLMNDYGSEWPIWEDGLTGPDDFKLSPRLVDALSDWSAYYQKNVSHTKGWVGGSREWYEKEGARLKRDLERELGSDFEISVDARP